MPMSPEVLAAGIGAIGAIIIALLGQFGAKRLGIGADQERLVNILKDTVNAQQIKIDELVKNDSEKDSRIKELENEVTELKNIIVNLNKRRTRRMPQTN